MGSVAPLATAARPLIAKYTAASCLPALQTTASAHNARLINGGTIGAASTFTGTVSFAAATITPELVNATTTATPAMPTPVMGGRRANICHQRLEYPNERIADYYRDYCKTTTIIQPFSSHNTPKHNGFSKRDGRTIMDVVQCMLNGAALPKSLRGKIAANVVCLFQPSAKQIVGGDTSYSKMFGKHVDVFFLWTIGTRPHEDRQPHLARTSRHTRSPDHLLSQNSNFELISFNDASNSTHNPEKAKSTSGSIHFRSGGPSTPALTSSTTTRGLCF